MGDWHISIQGTGCHHNDNYPQADKMARQFVKELKDAGHDIESATFTHGGLEDLMPEYDGPVIPPFEE